MMKHKRITKQTYDRIASHYARQYGDDVELELPYLKRFMHRIPLGKRVLDAGCGPGTFTKYIVQAGYVAHGIDISEAMLDEATTRVPRARFEQMDMNKLDYPDGYFAGIIAFYSLIHISSDELPQVLSEFARILKPGGYVFVVVQRGNIEAVRPYGIYGKTLVHFYQIETLEVAFLQAGMHLIGHDSFPWQSPDHLSDTVLCVTAQKKASAKRTPR